MNEDIELRRSDMVLIRAALKNGYNIPEIELSVLPAALMQIMANSESPQRNRIAAAKTLLELRKYELSKLSLLEKLTSDQDININIAPPPPPPPLRVIYQVAATIPQDNIEGPGDTAGLPKDTPGQGV